MRVLVVGSGGREHALAWKLAQSPKVTEVITAPGNPGTAAVGRNVAVQATDLTGLADLAESENVGLTVVGPEIPLCAGIVDVFHKRDLCVFGPTRAAAQLEGSKAFAKSLMVRAGVPTAGYRVVTNADAALQYLEGDVSYPVVVKASGLAGGKGVVICHGRDEAATTLRTFLEDRLHGEASTTVVLEDFLSGEEVSQFCITDGKTLLPLPAAQDHKRALDGDEGPNTGGMGAYSPVPVYTEALQKRIEQEVLVPTVHQMRVDGTPFCGLLYAGLMLTRSGPRVLEYNARFGDPETQVVLPRLGGDLFEILHAAATGRLAEIRPESLSVDPRAAVTVVLAAGGYPGVFRRGDVISGVEEAERMDGVHVFHAGTATRDGRLVTSGGRVLDVTALGTTVQEARERAYAAVERIRFEGRHVRRDIGARAAPKR